MLITAEANSAGLVVLDSRGSGHLAENVEILVAEGAHLTVVTLQEWADDAIHLASHFARVERDARLKHIVVSLGGGIVRINPSAHLAGAGSDVEMLGVYFADAGQHLEQQVFVHHDAPKSQEPRHLQGRAQRRRSPHGVDRRRAHRAARRRAPTATSRTATSC